MPKTVLTDVSVRALKPPPKGQVTVWDAGSPLGVRISQGGSKTYIVMTSSGQRHTIGRVGIISLSDARTEAKGIIAQKTLRIATKKPPSLKFEAARDLFVEQHYRDKKPRVKAEATRLLKKHFRKLRAHPLSEITDAQISRELDKLSHVPGEKLHAFRVLRTFFRWCTRPPRRYLSYSPLEGYQPPSQDGKRERVLSDDELKAVWKAANGLFGAIIKLLILTTARKMEIGSMRWDWIDEENLLTIPGSARKNGQPLTLPLGKLALSILEAQPRLGPFVFPGRYDTQTHIHRDSFGKLKRELDKRSGVSEWGIHDLRRTAATNIARFAPPHILQAILGHSAGPVSEIQAIYNKYEYLEEKREALEKWEA